MAKFNIGDAVKKIDGTKANGVIRYLACIAATKAGGKTCDKKMCAHNPQDYVWVEFQGATFSYHEAELEADVALANTSMDTKNEVLEKLSEQIEGFEKQITGDKWDQKKWDEYNSVLPGGIKLKFF